MRRRLDGIPTRGAAVQDDRLKWAVCRRCGHLRHHWPLASPPVGRYWRGHTRPPRARWRRDRCDCDELPATADLDEGHWCAYFVPVAEEGNG